MSLAETFRPEIVEAYKSSIMKRYELAQAKPKGANCHDAAYYLLGIEPQEYGLDGVCYVRLSIFEPARDINEAFLIAFGKVYESELCAVHLATLHPFDKTKVIHRDLDGYWPPDRPHNLFWSIYDWIEAFTVGSANPMRIEALERVQERWSGSGYFQMHLFKFRPEYYGKLLSSL